MLNDGQRSDCDALAGAMLRLVDRAREAGDRDGALLAGDVTDAIPAMLDHDGM